MMAIKGLTLYEPFASLIMLEEKRIETRSWPTNYRGWIAIHAGKSKEYLSLSFDQPFITALEPLLKINFEDGAIAGGEFDFKIGHIICVCKLRGCCPVEEFFQPTLITPKEITFGDYSPGRWGWILTDVKRLDKPIPARGMQRLWNLTEEQVDEIRKQVSLDA